MFFVPNGKQAEFIKSDKFITVFSGGNGSGKSFVGVNVVGNYIYGIQSKWFKAGHFTEKPTKRRVRIVSTYKNVEENIIPLMKAFFPPRSYTARKGTRTFLSEWSFYNGSYLDIMTYDTDPQQFAGPTVHLHWFDEPPPTLIFTEAVSRHREGGFMIITMTPLYFAGWIFDRINNPFFSKNEEWGLVTSDVEDNCIEHGVRGTLRHDNIERMLAEYPHEEREARKSGKPIFLSGVVFKNFNPDVHVIPRDKVPFNEGGSFYHVCDPHDRKPFALGWYFVDKTGDIYVIDEWPNYPYHEVNSCSETVEDYAAIIKDKEKDMKITLRIIDARYGNRKNVQTGETIRDEFDKFGVYYINSYTEDKASILAGHNKIQSLLRYDPTKPISSTNKPKLYFCEECRNHIYAMTHYTYKSQQDRDKAVKESPDEKYKDFPDLLRYLVMQNPVYYEPHEEEIVHPPERWGRESDVALTSYGE